MKFYIRFRYFYPSSWINNCIVFDFQWGNWHVYFASGEMRAKMEFKEVNI